MARRSNPLVKVEIASLLPVSRNDNEITEHHG
jgi:hypothetical protein